MHKTLNYLTCLNLVSSQKHVVVHLKVECSNKAGAMAIEIKYSYSLEAYSVKMFLAGGRQNGR